MSDLPTILPPIAKTLAVIVQLDAPIKAIWFVTMLALLSEYFALYQDPASEA